MKTMFRLPTNDALTTYFAMNNNCNLILLEFRESNLTRDNKPSQVYSHYKFTSVAI